MAVPKKRTPKSKTGRRRSHLLAKLQRIVNKKSPVKVPLGKQKKASGATAVKKTAPKAASAKAKAKTPAKTTKTKPKTAAKSSKTASKSKTGKTARSKKTSK